MASSSATMVLFALCVRAPITTRITRRSSAGPAPRCTPSAGKCTRSARDRADAFSKHRTPSANCVFTRAIVDAESGAASPSSARSAGSKSRCESPSSHPAYETYDPNLGVRRTCLGSTADSYVVPRTRGRRMGIAPAGVVISRSGSWPLAVINKTGAPSSTRS